MSYTFATLLIYFKFNDGEYTIFGLFLLRYYYLKTTE